MNFDIYKTLTPKEKLFADLLLDILKAVEPVKFKEEDYTVDEEINFGPLNGINDLDEVRNIAEANSAEGAKG